MGGDFNMEPAQLCEVDFVAKVGGIVVAPEKGTCRAGGVSSILDYMIIDLELAKMVKEVDIVEEVQFHPHRPVVVGMAARKADMAYFTFSSPPALHTRRIIGPVWDTPKDKWRRFQARVEEWPVLHRDSEAEAQEKLASTYEQWANIAEEEIAIATGQHIRLGFRAQRPKLVKKHFENRAIKSWAGPRAGEARQWAWTYFKFLEYETAVREEQARRILEIQQAFTRNRPHWLDNAEVLATVGRIMRMPTGPEEARAHEEAENMLWEQEAEQEMDTWCNLALRLKDKHEVATDQATKERQQRWKDWVGEALEGGARKVHRLLKEPEAWVPEEVQEEGKISTDPRALHRYQVKFWHNIWTDGDKLEAYQWPADLAWNHEALPAITAEDIETASKEFSASTAGSPDGWHPRHFSLLCREARTGLCGIMNTMEKLGRMPPQTEQLMIMLLAKPQGGYRPIGIFPSIYRLWMKIRRPICAEWERRWHRPFFGMAEGREPGDSVWRTAIRAEAAQRSNQAAATLMWDMVKAYEMIRYSHLVREAVAVGFPLTILKLNIRAYTMVRYISMRGMVLRCAAPKRGIGAGCGAATTLIKVNYLRPFTEANLRIPRLRLSIFVDDVELSQEGTEQDIIKEFPVAARIIKEVIEGDLDSAIAEDKAAVVASSAALAKKLRQQIGWAAGKPTEVAKNLGVDISAGKARMTRATTTTRRLRILKAAKAVGRLKMFKAVMPGKIKRFNKTNVLPKATYGAQVSGVDNGELLRIRRLVAKQLPPFGGGRSLKRTLLYHGDPTAAVATAATSRWAKEIWHSANGQKAGAMRFTELQVAWQLCQKRFGRTWNTARGPLDVMMLELDRIGWSMPEFNKLKDGKGNEMKLTDFSPKAITTMLDKAFQENLARQIAKDLGSQEELSAQPWRRETRSKKYDNMQQGLLRAFAAGGLWTNKRQMEAGYIVEKDCCLCTGCEDTMAHRLFECKNEEVRKIREEIMEGNPFFLERASDPRNRPTFEAGLCPVPQWPLPEEGAAAQYWIWDEAGEAHPAGEGDRELGGHIFTDGSCSGGEQLQQLARAGWAAVEVQPETGKPIRALFGPVWRSLPQTAQASEWVAMAAAHQAALVKTVAVTSDCAAVVVGMKKKGGPGWLDHRDPWAGIRRSIIDTAGYQNIGMVDKVKAHQKGNKDWRAVANDWADKLANQGRHMQPQPTDAERGALNLIIKDIKTLAELVVKIFPKWPSPAKNGRRPGRGKAMAKRLGIGHEWVHGRMVLQCRWCFSKAAAQTAPTRTETCPMRKAGTSLVESLQWQGHQLIEVITEGNKLLVCKACGRFAKFMVRGIAGQCKRSPAPGGANALSRLARFLHPRPGDKVEVGGATDLLHGREFDLETLAPSSRPNRKGTLVGEARGRDATGLHGKAAAEPVGDRVPHVSPEASSSGQGLSIAQLRLQAVHARLDGRLAGKLAGTG
jgi:ribonuclease HI